MSSSENAMTDGPAYADYRCVSTDDLAEMLAMLDEAMFSCDFPLTERQREVVRRVRTAVKEREADKGSPPE